MSLTYVYIFLAALVAVLIGWRLHLYFYRRRILRDLDLRLLAVRLPSRGLEKNEASPKEVIAEIAASAQLLSVLATEESPVVLEVAVPHVGEEITFYVAVPQKKVEFAMRQIEGLWGGAQIELVVGDYTIFNPQGVAKIAIAKLAKHCAIPLRTYVDAELDTFAPILSNFSKINTVGEGLALQLVIRPATSLIKKRIGGFIYKLKQGQKLEDLLDDSLLGALTPTLSSKTKEEKNESKIIDEEAVKTLEQKISKPLYAVNIRLAASAPTPFRADELLEGLSNSLSGFSAPQRNEVKIANQGSARAAIFRFTFREFNEKESLVLNSEEITSLFHFPLSTTDIPKIKSVKSREAAPPVVLPSEGSLIGESSFRGEHKPIFITDEDRRRHVYIIGQTGTGKTTLLKSLIAADIAAGKGVAIIDPHGELVDDALSLVPESRRQDVIIFDPSDRLFPLGLNMLEYDFNYPEQKTFIVNEMQGIFTKLFPESGEALGPVFQQYMRNALLLLLEDAANEPATLMEVSRVFTDADFRIRKLKRITNPVVIDFWEKEAIKVGGEASLANITPYITSKFSNFVANDYVRPIIGQTKSAFNFRQVMDEGKILLVNLSKGRIGDINAGLLGMIIVGKLLMAALSRGDMPLEKRRDFNLFVDEFQNFSTDSISTILSEARKYRLNLVVAHQFIAQLAEKIRDAVFGNVGSMIVFRVGADDVEFLEKQFAPVFGKQDLLNIDNFNAYARLLINGATTKPFNMRTLRVPIGNDAIRDSLKELSRQTYGASRSAVEAEILKRLRE